jgi:hypothetical protein
LITMDSIFQRQKWFELLDLIIATTPVLQTSYDKYSFLMLAQNFFIIINIVY